MKSKLITFICISLCFAFLIPTFPVMSESVEFHLLDAPVSSIGVSSDTVSEKLTESAASISPISGYGSYGERTKRQIIARLNSLTSISTVVYDSMPSVSPPYGLGKLNSQYINEALDLINYYRYISKLPDVALSDTKVTDAQYGAVLLAATDSPEGDLSHTPAKPEGMSEAFYRRAYSATDSSCIGLMYGMPENKSLDIFIRACVDETSTISNLMTVSHRRWFLDPYMFTMGFGQAISKTNQTFPVISLDYDVEGNENYDFISWPPSGWCPDNIISSSVPWNISFNFYKYKFDSIEDVRVQVTRMSDGRVFSFAPEATPNFSPKSQYMYADEIFYGIPLNITFNIGSDNQLSSTLSGDYKVKVTGVKTKAGADTVFEYTTKFFSVNNPGDVDEPTLTSPTVSITPTTPTSSTDPTSSTNPSTEPTTKPTTTEPTTKPTTTAPATLKSISINSMPSKTSYNFKDNLNTSGMTLKLTYSDGSTKSTSSGFSCSPTYLNSVGNQQINVTYGTCQTSFNVSVSYTFFQSLIVYVFFGWLWYR